MIRSGAGDCADAFFSPRRSPVGGRGIVSRELRFRNLLAARTCSGRIPGKTRRGIVECPGTAHCCSLPMNLGVAASRQSAANPTPASMRRSTGTPPRFMAPMRAHCWRSKLPMNRSADRLIGLLLMTIGIEPIRRSALCVVQGFKTRTCNRRIPSPGERVGVRTGESAKPCSLSLPLAA